MRNGVFPTGPHCLRPRFETVGTGGWDWLETGGLRYRAYSNTVASHVGDLEVSASMGRIFDKAPRNGGGGERDQATFGIDNSAASCSPVLKIRWDVGICM